MLVTIAIFLVTIPVKIMTFVGSLLAVALPVWLNSGIGQIMGGSSWWGSILPLQAHPGMWGLAGQTGILPMFGFILLMAGYLVIIRIGIFIVGLFMSFIPWHTNTVKAPHNV